MKPTVIIIGRPNVGKSTLFNRLIGKKLALVDDQPGVTRDRRFGDAVIARLEFQIVDTAGWEDEDAESLPGRMRKQTEVSLEGADAAMFVFDSRIGLTPLDEEIGRWLRQQSVPVVLVANKAEGRAGEAGVFESYGLGLGEPVPLSAEHGEGVADLFGALWPVIGEKAEAKDEDAVEPIDFDEDEDEERPRGPLKLAIVGRPNAGKSTLINILAGLVDKTDGSAEIWGFDIDRQRRNAKRSIGIVPQEIVFDPFFTPFEVLENQAGFYGIPKAERRSEELLEAVRLSDKRDAYARTLSGGMKRRLLIAKAMVHSPPILVLDEPTAGVDVELRRQLWELVTELNREGVTVVLTTHYLEEAEQLCDRIAIINHGELIADKPTRELVDMAREKIVSITVDKDLGGPIMEPAFTKAEVIEPRRLEITYDRDRTSAGQVLALVQSHGYAIEDVTTREADLEDVFVQLTGAG